MEKYRKYYYGLSCACLLLMAVSACGKKDEPAPTPKPIPSDSAKIVLSQTDTVLEQRCILQLTAKVVSDSSKTVTWSSSDEKVAIVDEFGLVTALGVGKAEIIASADNGKAACKLVVNQGEAPPSSADLSIVLTTDKNEGERLFFNAETNSGWVNIDCGDGIIRKVRTQDPADVHEYNKIELKLGKSKEIKVYGRDDVLMFDAQRNGITAANTSQARGLHFLYLRRNRIKTLDITHNKKLEGLFVSNNQIEKITVGTYYPLMRFYFCDRNKLKDIDISNMRELTYLQAAHNELTEIDLSSSKSLNFISLTDNKLPTIDLSPCKELIYFFASKNEFKKLDLTHCSLGAVWCNDNKLTELLLGDTDYLVQVNCAGNRLPVTSFNTLYAQFADLSGGKQFGTFLGINNPGYEKSDKNIAINKKWRILNTEKEMDDCAPTDPFSPF